MKRVVARYGFQEPTEFHVVEVDEGLYDLFDQEGHCWNEGSMFPFIMGGDWQDQGENGID
jgi:hypothetical protein